MSAAQDFEQSQFDGLTTDQQQRLSELLDEYLAGRERGEPTDRAQLIAANPDLAEAIQVYLESLDFLQDAAAGFGPSMPPAETSADDGMEVLAEVSAQQPGQGKLAGEKRLGDFRIVEEIGRGGMGVVYEAWQLSLDRRVALKVLPFAALLDGKQIARFRNEAQAAARLHHANIVPVFAVGTERGVHYYAMQYIDGQPLDRVVAAVRQTARPQGKPSLPAADPASQILTTAYVDDSQGYFQNVAQLGVQAARALHAAHEEGIVHRDIKPSNLLLDVDGKLWVADFGLARCRHDSKLTGSADIVGTMRYMSPEQTRGNAAIVDHRSDLYSLGATLYELLTLRQAVRGEDAAAIMRHLDCDEAYSPRQWDSNIPIDLETIVLKAMAKLPDARYATADDMADDLQRFRSGQPINARRPTLVDRIGKWTWRHKYAALSVALVLLVALIGLAIGTALLARQSRRTTSALQAAQENFQQYRRQLARTKNHLAMLQEQQGDPTAAEASFHEAAQVQREILSEHPADASTLRDLSVTLNNLGFLQSRDDVQRAVIAYGQAIDVQRRLVQLAPEDAFAQKDLALASSNLGALFRRHGNARRAVELLGQACAMLEASVASGQLAARHGHDLAVSYNNLGMAQSDLGQLESAQKSFLAALRAAEDAAATAAATPGHLSALGGIYNNLGMVHERQLRLPDAAACFAHAIQFQRQALQRAPQVDRFRKLLDRHYVQGARLTRQIGNTRQSAEWIAARQTLWPRDPRHLWSVAGQWASLACDDANEEAESGHPTPDTQRHQAQAMAALRQAISLGLRADQEMLDGDLAKVAEDADDVREWLATANARS